MVYKQSIGRVVGEPGKTYIPTVSSDNGILNIDFEATDTNESNDTVSSSIILPYIVPYRDDEEGKIKFRVESLTSSDNIQLPEISFDDIEGPQGPTGEIAIEFIDVNDANFDIEDLEFNTIYVDTENNAQSGDIDTYVLKEDAGGNKVLKKISAIIDLSRYYTKTEVNTEIDKVVNYVNQNVYGVISEQVSINNILNNGLEIPEVDYQSVNNVVNVMSDATVEDIMEQITEELKGYIREQDITFDPETGTINIKMNTG